MEYERLTDKDIAVTLNYKDKGYNEAKCSACNQKLSKEYEQFNYCPYCGARLR